MEIAFAAVLEKMKADFWVAPGFHMFGESSYWEDPGRWDRVGQGHYWKSSTSCQVLTVSWCWVHIGVLCSKREYVSLGR